MAVGPKVAVRRALALFGLSQFVLFQWLAPEGSGVFAGVRPRPRKPAVAMRLQQSVRFNDVVNLLTEKQMKEEVHWVLSCRQRPMGVQGDGLGMEQHHHGLLLLCKESKILMHLTCNKRDSFPSSHGVGSLEFKEVSEDAIAFARDWSVFDSTQPSGMKVEDLAQQLASLGGYDLVGNNCQHVSGSGQGKDYWSKTCSKALWGMIDSFLQGAAVHTYVAHFLEKEMALEEAMELLKAGNDGLGGFAPGLSGQKYWDALSDPARRRAFKTGITVLATCSHCVARVVHKVASELQEDVANLRRMLPSLDEEFRNLKQEVSFLERLRQHGELSELLRSVQSLKSRFGAVRAYVLAVLEEARKKERQAEERRKQAAASTLGLAFAAAAALVRFALPAFAAAQAAAGAAGAATGAGAAIEAAAIEAAQSQLGPQAAAGAAGAISTVKTTFQTAACGTITIAASTAIAHDAMKMEERDRDKARAIARDMKEKLEKLADMDRTLHHLEKLTC